MRTITCLSLLLWSKENTIKYFSAQALASSCCQGNNNGVDETCVEGEIGSISHQERHKWKMGFPIGELITNMNSWKGIFSVFPFAKSAPNSRFSGSKSTSGGEPSNKIINIPRKIERQW
jgi:hypothetical protein